MTRPPDSRREPLVNRLNRVLSAVVASIAERRSVGYPPFVQSRDIAGYWHDQPWGIIYNSNPTELKDLPDNVVREMLDLLVEEGRLDTFTRGGRRYYTLPDITQESFGA